MENDRLQLFEDQPIRTAWNEEEEEWYFSVVDVVGILVESKDPPAYWRKLKQRLKKEGNETVTNCHGLKLKAADGKRRLTDVANTEQLLRLIQSIPSKKAEPFKLWLAQVGRERIDETLDPELIADRLVATYERKGYTREWINQRLMAISARKDLTDEWKARGIKQGKEFAILTDELTKAWSGMSTRQYKNLKGLKKESLRDNMSTTELVLNMLAETATREFSEAEKPEGFDQSISVAKRGGTVAGDARKAIEQGTGKSIVTSKKASELNHVVTQMIETSASTVQAEEDKEIK
ncbi:MAG: Bro-N domain-containing protein [Selenomonas sp.]|uniref:BRO-N domain-containing protein n=1 Tax=Selenomonas sp. TaxID=2053611 RepID=UPI0025DB19CB|nr:Bro-N domain-containing protein [Selenomonas sp.]MCR5439115.1 Bro-N domain-containing protein [Selenomonas sp.]